MKELRRVTLSNTQVACDKLKSECLTDWQIAWSGQSSPGPRVCESVLQAWGAFFTDTECVRRAVCPGSTPLLLRWRKRLEWKVLAGVKTAFASIFTYDSCVFYFLWCTLAETYTLPLLTATVCSLLQDNNEINSTRLTMRAYPSGLCGAASPP